MAAAYSESVYGGLSQAEREQRLTEAYTTILEVSEGSVRPGTADTAGRAARAMLEMTSGYDMDVEAIFRTAGGENGFDAEGYDEMIVERGIPFTSLCEHHLLPFTGVAHIAYVPDGKIVGLSKLARLVEAFARRFQVQERLTQQVADALEQHLHPQGIMVVVEASHECMSVRGVRKPGVVATTSVLRGLIKDDPAARAEALQLARL